MNIFAKLIVLVSVFTGVGVAILFPADRDSRWEAKRLYHLQHVESSCQWCGNDNIKELEVHHILQVSQWKKYELTEPNYITMCHSCQFIVGHNRNFSGCNPFVREECAIHRANMKRYAEKIKQLEKEFAHELGQTLDN